ncbi:hypothetical protein ANCCEY_12753 [Ancylostoma ceylanicum]|uniref:Uncharacterized protein n=1 Tax=Ancylostoma ceylanicum TaxID=53326 RepID=A0A0D6L8Z4_9BILA|nr:hypothetical protein ANCCEY_12753 [Ancylostoma ceylanicum]
MNNENNLVALQQNRTAALTTNIALESTDDSRFILPEVRRDTEDPTRLFEALEKPETLDLKEEEASLEKLTTRKTQARRKAARQKKEKLAQTTEFDFYRLEKPEEISKEERLELEQMMLPQPTARKPGQTQKVDSKQKAEAVRRKLSSVRQTRVEKSQRIQPKSDELQSDAKRRKKEPLKKQETSQRKTRAEFRRLDSSKKTQKSQYVDLPQKSLVLDVSQKTERRSRREVSKKSQRSLRRIWSRRISNPLRVESSLKLSKTRKEEASQRATKAQQKEQSSDPLSIKESPTVEAESDPDETSAKKSSSMPAINVCHRSRDPPTCHYKYVTVRMEMTGQDLDVNITENLVLIFVPFTSPAFYHLVIGDQKLRTLDLNKVFHYEKAIYTQIIECDGLVPKSLREFYEFLYSSNREVEQQTMGAFAFLTVDRVLDVDSDKLIRNLPLRKQLSFRAAVVHHRPAIEIRLVSRQQTEGTPRAISVPTVSYSEDPKATYKLRNNDK